jgi:hypothetical protein
LSDFGLTLEEAEAFRHSAGGLMKRVANSITGNSAYQKYIRYQTALRNYEKALTDYHRLTAERASSEQQRQRQAEQDAWLAWDGWVFERQLAELLRQEGWISTATRGSGDEGVDLILTAGQVKVVVQCKAHSKPIGPGPVRELFGTLVHQGATEAWLVSTAGFSSAARAWAAGKNIRLLTISEILRDRQLVSASGYLPDSRRRKP